MELFVILTVRKQRHPNGPVDFYTTYATLTAGPEATRAEVFEHVREKLPEHLRDGVAVLWSCEPLRFGHAPNAALAPAPEPAAS